LVRPAFVFAKTGTLESQYCSVVCAPAQFSVSVARLAGISDNGLPCRERTVKIQIYDQSYNVNADGNEEYLTELAAYVDGKMRSIAESTHMVDSLKVAVLAALNIADETFAMRKRQQEIEGPLRQRVEHCVSMVEKALEQTN
jgi:cell division protein ZapA